MPEISVESVDGRVTELRERIVEVDNTARATEAKLEKLQNDLTMLMPAVQHLNMVGQQTFMSSISNQVIIDALTRYLAGYKAEDFAAEVKDSEENKKEEVPILPKNGSDFDVTRFYGLIEMIGNMVRQSMAQGEAKAAEKAGEVASPAAKMAEETKAKAKNMGLHVVKTPPLSKP